MLLVFDRSRLAGSDTVFCSSRCGFKLQFCLASFWFLLRNIKKKRIKVSVSALFCFPLLGLGPNNRKPKQVEVRRRTGESENFGLRRSGRRTEGPGVLKSEGRR